MSALTDYIKLLLEETRGLSDEEAKRYIYIDLCKTLSFDIKFSGANEAKKREIYRNSVKEEVVEKYFEEKVGLCTTASVIFEKIMKLRFPNMKIETVMDIEDDTRKPHAYNVETLPDGTKVKYDLQQDFENVKTNSIPYYYAINLETKNPIYSRFELEKIDRKIGYIDDENYYSDDYKYLLKSDMGYFDNFEEKADFIITNLEPIYGRKINYLERKWHHEQLLKRYFTEDERDKIKQIDCFFNTRNGRKYTPCICVLNSEIPNIYWFDENEEQYKKITMKDMAIKVNAGLQCYPQIPGLNEYVRKMELDEL